MKDTGERQVAPSIDKIRKDHVNRYKWAATRFALNKFRQVYDLGCGVGYGSKIIAEAGYKVCAIDQSLEAIIYGKKHYDDSSIKFEAGDISDCSFAPADAAVCFELIEHLEDPRPMLKSLAASVPLLLASVPNEEVFPWKNYAFHFRHYTRAEFAALLDECGWQVTEWHGQIGTESPVRPDVNGRTLIAVAVPKKSLSPSAFSLQPSACIPKSVAIIGLGASKSHYVDIACGMGGRGKFFDEVWAINALGNVLDCDRIFHMDDVRIQEIRAAARPDCNIAAMLKWMKTTDKPIMTSRLHPDYPTLVEMPLEDLINNVAFEYFNSTAAWAMAYAIHIGVEKVGLFGCDFTYPNAHDAEKGRACLEFWIGYGAARGMRIEVAPNTTLMDACYPRSQRLYGYDTRKVILRNREDGKLKVEFEEIEDLPTADEIEHRYDHSRHPNAMVSEMEENQ